MARGGVTGDAVPPAKRRKGASGGAACPPSSSASGGRARTVASIACASSLSERHVRAAVALLDDECTVPFIARYRKEATGGMDEHALRDVAARLADLDRLESRRDAILSSLDKSGSLHPSLERAVRAADTHRTRGSLPPAQTQTRDPRRRRDRARPRTSRGRHPGSPRLPPGGPRAETLAAVPHPRRPRRRRRPPRRARYHRRTRGRDFRGARGGARGDSTRRTSGVTASRKRLAEKTPRRAGAPAAARRRRAIEGEGVRRRARVRRLHPRHPRDATPTRVSR